MATRVVAATFAATAALESLPAAAQSFPSRTELRQELLDRGYTDVQIESMGRTLATVLVCSGGRRERLQVDRQLRARLLDTLGQCGFNPDDFRDRYSGGSGSGGDVFNPTPRPGPQPISPALRAVSRDLDDMGFGTITFEDEVQGEVSATACRDDFQYRARYDSAYKLVDLYRVGDCPPDFTPQPPTPGTGAGAPPSGVALSARAVADRLFAEGYRRVFVDGQRDRLFEISGCFGIRRFEMLVDNRAVIQARRAAGFCNITEGDAEYIAPRPISEELLQSSAPLDPPLCQQVLNWLQYNRPLTFESGSARLDAASLDLVRQMAAGVGRCGTVRILVEGHTDSISSSSANQRLSEQRAQSVARVLVREGVQSYAVSSSGFGEDYPIASNATSEGRALNRRIELNLEWGRF